MFLSGTIVPVESMPATLQTLSLASPIRFYLESALGTLLKGVGWSVLWPQLAILAAMATGLIGISLRRLRRRLVYCPARVRGGLPNIGWRSTGAA